MVMDTRYSLMVHGGAGALAGADDPLHARRYLDGLQTVLEAGRAILARGGSALDTVEHCVALLEDDPLFNAGRGSVLHESGGIEMDAGLMDGQSLAAGAVAAVRGIANPIRLARRVLEAGDAVLLVGQGAERFATACGIPEMPESHLVTLERQEEWDRIRARRRPAADPDPRTADSGGTVGSVARDRHGHLAAATSTGGRVNKSVGRVGDSPLIGAGVYADDETCAVSATGHGEDLMRVLLARTIANAIEYRGLDAAGAMAFGMQVLRNRVSGYGGAIGIDRQGSCAAGHTTPRMAHGWIPWGGDVQCRL
jgi:L-asparaginase / beta-aspartyl-peptidase